MSPLQRLWKWIGVRMGWYPGHLQQAIDAAKPGDVIHLVPGGYPEDLCMVGDVTIAPTTPVLLDGNVGESMAAEAAATAPDGWQEEGP